MINSGVFVLSAWNTGLRSRRRSQFSHGHARECTRYISTGISVVPNFEIWFEIPTNATAAAYSSDKALALHIVA